MASCLRAFITICGGYLLEARGERHKQWIIDGMIDNQYYSYPSRVDISFSMEAPGSSICLSCSIFHVEVEIHRSEHLGLGAEQAGGKDDVTQLSPRRFTQQGFNISIVMVLVVNCRREILGDFA